METNYINVVPYMCIAGPPTISVSATLMNSLNNAALFLNVPTDAVDNLYLQSVSGTLVGNNGSTIVRSESQTVDVNRSSLMINFADLNLCDYTYSYTLMGIGIVSTALISGNVVIRDNKGNILNIIV